jgi:hypothetical protein
VGVKCKGDLVIRNVIEFYKEVVHALQAKLEPLRLLVLVRDQELLVVLLLLGHLKYRLVL